MLPAPRHQAQAHDKTPRRLPALAVVALLISALVPGCQAGLSCDGERCDEGPSGNGPLPSGGTGGLSGAGSSSGGSGPLGGGIAITAGSGGSSPGTAGTAPSGDAGSSGSNASGGMTSGGAGSGGVGGADSGSNTGGVAQGGVAQGGVAQGGASGAGTAGSGGSGGSMGSGGAGGKAGSGGAGGAGGNSATAGSGGAGGVSGSAGSSSAGSSSGGGGTGQVDPYASARQTCVDRVNQLRATKGLGAIPRLSSAEDCVDGQAKSDSESGKAHGSFSACLNEVTGWTGAAQNECPGWGSVADTLGGCIDAMWGEGPGGGHYENMVGDYDFMACGFYTTPQGKVWMVQDFWRK